jgi:chemosensory pili system protein ChpA (sensor histidine kinase/response regulator)
MEGTKMNQAIDFSTLTWVKNELDETLKEARQSLEAYVEDNSDTAQPGFLAAHLHQVYGTLQMVELYGAALLAEEMEQVAKAIADGSVTRQNDACDVLMRAILQLPDYLDRLISGCQDIPLVLLPVLNDLRAVRGANLLSENVMFSPDLDAALPDNVSNYTVDGDLAADIKDLRHRFQIGLLGWFRGGGNEQQSLEALSSVLDTLHGLCAAEPVARFWWVAAGVVDAVLSGSLNGSASVKRLMGQVDRQIKRLVDHGEQVLVKEPATDVMKNLLFYVAQSSGGIERIDAIQSTYRLQELLPGEEEMAAARESLSGQNSDLFATVAVAVKEELARLKDQLDIALRNGCEDTDALQEMVQSLGSLGDTLGMLSLGEARTAVVSRVKELGTYLQAGDAPPSTVLMDMANTLLFVESSVESMGSGRSVDVSEDSVDEHLAKSEFNQVMDVVLREAITDLARAKEAIVGYTSGGDEADGLAEVPQWFNQVKGGLLLLEETRAASIIDAAAKYIEDKLIPGDGESQEKELESLADAICGLEYYLESRREHRMYGDSAMDVAEKGIESLGYPVQADADEPTDMQVEDAAEREEELAPFDLDFDEVSGADELLVSNAPEVTGETGSSARNEEETVAEDVPVFPEMDADQDLPADESLTDVDQVESPAAGDVAVCVQEEDEGLAIIGDEIDEEILEIFIEEAEEEIESLSTLLPQWIKNNDNGEALETVRRSFHTLKGSGRLVGAMRIGEFAWAYENMLNRIIDGTIEVSAPVTDILGRVLDALVELVEQVKNGSPVVQPVSWLMQCADAISKGEEPPAAPDVSARTNVSDVEADAEEIPFIQGDQELTGADSDQPELVSSTQSEDAVDMAATDNSLIVDSVMDPMLYEIFNSESRGHLEVIRQFLGRVDNGDACIDDALTRALHTLHGSAHMAGSDPIADLAGELEQYTKQLSVAGVEIPEAGCAVLQETVAQIQDMLDVLPGEHRAPEGFDDLLSRIQVLRESSPTVPGETLFQEEMLESQAESDGENRPDESVDDQLYADIDPELLEIFLEESEENLETSDAALDRWRKDSEDHEALAELQRALHTVKGGARMAELGVVGDLAHAVESLIITVNDCGAAANDDALHGVQRAQDALVSVLDEVRNHKPMSAHDALISELQVLRENVMSGSRAEAGADDAEVVDEVASDADVEV